MRTNTYLWLKSGQRTRAWINHGGQWWPPCLIHAIRTGAPVRMVCDGVGRNRGPGKKFSTGINSCCWTWSTGVRGFLKTRERTGIRAKNSRFATLRAAAAIFNWHVGRQLAEFPELTFGGHLI